MLQRIDDATQQLRNSLHRSTPNPKGQHVNRMAALNERSAGLEIRLRRAFDGWVKGTADSRPPTDELAAHFQAVAGAVADATTPGSPLRRREALRRAERALSSALQELEAQYAGEGEEVNGDAD